MEELEDKAMRCTTALMSTILAAEEETIAVVCHSGVIQQLTGIKVQNCDCVQLSVTAGKSEDAWSVLDSTYIPRVSRLQRPIPNPIPPPPVDMETAAKVANFEPGHGIDVD